jgi:hypothetical protein
MASTKTTICLDAATAASKHIVKFPTNFIAFKLKNNRKHVDAWKAFPTKKAEP